MILVFLVGGDEADIEREASALARGEILIRRFETVDAACESARTDPPTLILLDTRLPGLEAGSAVGGLRAAGSGAPVLFVATALERERWDGAGADGVVTRPVTAARLLDLLRRHASLVERGGARKRSSFRVELRAGEVEIAGYTHDVGANGLLLHAKEALQVGDDVEVRFGAPFLAGSGPFEARAIVVRVGPSEGEAGRAIALRFTKIPAAHRRALARFLREGGRGSG